MTLTSEVKHIDETLISIVLTLTERTVCPEAFTILCADNWNAHSGRALVPGMLADFSRGWRRRLMPELIEKAGEYALTGRYSFYPEYKKLLKANLLQYNLFVEDGRSVIFCQPGILCPASEGAVFFTLDAPPRILEKL